MSELVAKAKKIARILHYEQKDRQGMPYIDHCERVADGVEGENAKIVAWLHDSLEDVLTDRDGWRRLLAMGVPNECVRDIVALTRCKQQDYADYIEGIAQRGGIALEVKLSDLRDNLRPCPGAEHLHARYRKAIERLELAQKSA